MPVLDTGEVSLDYLVRGSGRPVTVFAHGIGATIAETRTLGSGVLGRKVFFAFRGHGGSTVPAGPPGDVWGYPALARDLAAVADRCTASRALGVSMGAGALLALLAETPERFERLVFFLPAAIDAARPDVDARRVERGAQLFDSGDADAIAAMLYDELPPGAREMPGAADYVAAQGQELARLRLGDAARAIARAHPLADRSALRAVHAPALVIGQQGDDVHAAWVAEELAAGLPNARLHVFREAGALWLARRRLRELIAGFLNQT
jgi:pimeloyl-ACP methyl ester carboxylesterase